MNGADRAVRLSEAKAQSIADDITRLLRKSHVSVKCFRSVLGRLQHAAQILPAAKGALLQLNKAIKGNPPQVGVGKSGKVQAALLDLWHLVLTLASRPAHTGDGDMGCGGPHAWFLARCSEISPCPPLTNTGFISAVPGLKARHRV